MNLGLKFVILFSFAVSFSVHSGERGHGGDTALISVADIQLYITEELKKELLATFEWVYNAHSGKEKFNRKEVAMKELVLKLNSIDFSSDIYKSTYEINESCIDLFEQPKGATAVLNDKDGVICWSPNFIASRGNKIMESDLVALAFHEHLHHFNIIDSNHEAAAIFKSLYLKRLTSIEKLRQKVKPSLLVNSNFIEETSFVTIIEPLLKSKGWDPVLVDAQTWMMEEKFQKGDRWIDFGIDLVTEPNKCILRTKIQKLVDVKYKGDGKNSQFIKPTSWETKYEDEAKAKILKSGPVFQLISSDVMAQNFSTLNNVHATKCKNAFIKIIERMPTPN